MKYCPACNATYPDNERFCPTEGRRLSYPDPYHLVGQVLLEKYRIDALVGLGGMGAVYSAHHLTINRHIAIKILQPNLVLGNEHVLELFQREAEMAGQLNHENIVDIKDAGRTPDNIAYIVMEWLEGSTLDEEIEKSQQISFERAAAILRQVAAALDHAHAHHIIHRDLKPSNIMLVRSPDGREHVKVVDFGIAKVVSESTAPGASPVSLMVGTPHYASPEQFMAGSHLDGRSDIYSLGVTLYKMLCGCLPFAAQNLQELVKLQRTIMPPPIRQFRPDVPPLIEQLLFQMLDKEPGKRPKRAIDASNIFTLSLRDEGGQTSRTDGDWPATYVNSLVSTVSESAPTTAEGIHVSDTARNRIAITDQRLSAATVGGRAKAALPPTVHVEKQQGNKLRALAPFPYNKDAKKYVIAGALALAVFAGLLALYLGIIYPRLFPERGALQPTSSPGPASISSNQIELMSYYLDISSDDCRTISRGTGDETLSATQTFRLHFLPQRSGHLYIIAQNEKNVPKTFLTALPDPETGVVRNFVNAGENFGFPSGDGLCIGITDDERMMALTIIFSPKVLSSPAFLAAPAGLELTATQQ